MAGPLLLERAGVRRLARFGLVAAALVVSLGADVLVARVVAPRWAQVGIAARLQRGEIERAFRTRSDIFDHALKPMVTVPDARWGYLSYPIATNSLGFKDSAPRDVPLRSPDRRVLFIGDSFTEGIGFPYTQTFVGRVDAALHSTGVEVLNAGVSSYSPAIYYAKIKHLIETVGLSFDEVVVYIDLSDAQDDAFAYRVDRDGHVQATGAPPSGPQPDYLRRSLIERFLFNRTLLAKTIVFSIRDRQLALVATDALATAVNDCRASWTFDPDRFNEYGRAGLQAMTENMDRLAELLAAHHIPLTIAVYPWPGQVLFDSTSSLQVTHWRAWAERHSAGFLDYFPAFLSPPDHIAVIRRYFLYGDAHWNAEGHRLVADGYLDYRRRVQGGD